MLKEYLGIKKQTCLDPNKCSLIAPFINFYLHPENQNRYVYNDVILKVKEYFDLPGMILGFALDIYLHTKACLFTDNRFGLFFSLMAIYILKIKVKYQYF